MLASRFSLSLWICAFLLALPVGLSAREGFIDTSGKFVIAPTYNLARDFSEGLVAVRNERKAWGYINKRGEPVT